MKETCIVTTSWDDGHLADGKLASLLLDYGIKGTFYIAKNCVESFSNTDLVKKLDKNFEVGAHTLSHHVLTHFPNGKAISEIKGSKEWLEKLVNHEVEMFCYPKGRYDKRVVELVEKAGFKGARTLNFETVFPRDQFLLGISCHASNGSPLLRLRASLKSCLSLESLLDWGSCAKMLFNYILKNGGIWHLWGHSWEIEKNRDWEKLEEVFEYVSNRKHVSYLENRQIIKLVRGSPCMERYEGKLRYCI